MQKSVCDCNISEVKILSILNFDEQYKNTTPTPQKNPNHNHLLECLASFFFIVLSSMALANDTKLTCSVSWFNPGCQTIERTTNGDARPQRNFNGTWTEQVSCTSHICSHSVMGKHIANLAELPFLGPRTQIFFQLQCYMCETQNIVSHEWLHLHFTAYSCLTIRECALNSQLIFSFCYILLFL